MATAQVAAGRPAVGETSRILWHLGLREIRMAIRVPAYFLPNLIMPVLFFFIMVGSLSGFAEGSGIANYDSFQLPVSLMFAVTGGSAGMNMVTDIESGYFDKLLLTPTSRFALLIGGMGADFARVVVQGLFVCVVAVAVGTPFATGPAGILVMVLVASAWGLAYSAIGFAMALRTGNPMAVQSLWALQIPFLFFSTAFAPLSAMDGWLGAVARYNPMTYLLGAGPTDGLRTLSMQGWQADDILIALAIALAFGVVTMTMAFRALLSRVR